MASHSYTENDLYAGIMANSLNLTSMYLGFGVNPNETPELPDLQDLLRTTRLLDVMSYRIACYGSTEYQLTNLHAAVANCYYNWDKCSAALSILHTMLAAGADPTLKTHSVALYNRHSCAWLKIEGLTPAGLAAILKQNTGQRTNFTDICHSVMDEVILMLVQAELKDKIPAQMTNTAGTTDSASDVWSKMLLSEDFSDVEFQCSDGKVLPAHKAVLAASSPYFRRYFKGPWALSNPSHIWKTDNDSRSMQTVLTFIYTGEANMSDLLHDRGALLSIAEEYDMSRLIDEIEGACAQTVSVDNIKENIQLAHLYGLHDLQQTCTDFVRANSLRLMFDEDFMELAKENSDIWTELESALSPGDGCEHRRKRARKE
jgi:BTB/POZ domain